MTQKEKHRQSPGFYPFGFSDPKSSVQFSRFYSLQLNEQNPLQRVLKTLPYSSPSPSSVAHVLSSRTAASSIGKISSPSSVTHKTPLLQIPKLQTKSSLQTPKLSRKSQTLTLKTKRHFKNSSRETASQVIPLSMKQLTSLIT